MISVLIATTVRLYSRLKARVRSYPRWRAPLSFWSTDELCKYGIPGYQTSSNADTAILDSSRILRPGRGEADHHCQAISLTWTTSYLDLSTHEAITMTTYLLFCTKDVSPEVGLLTIVLSG
jgi:hypothetical protein